MNILRGAGADGSEDLGETLGSNMWRWLPPANVTNNIGANKWFGKSVA